MLSIFLETLTKAQVENEEELCQDLLPGLSQREPRLGAFVMVNLIANEAAFRGHLLMAWPLFAFSYRHDIDEFPSLTGFKGFFPPGLKPPQWLCELGGLHLQIRRLRHRQVKELLCRLKLCKL